MIMGVFERGQQKNLLRTQVSPVYTRVRAPAASITSAILVRHFAVDHAHSERDLPKNLHEHLVCSYFLQLTWASKQILTVRRGEKGQDALRIFRNGRAAPRRVSQFAF